MSDVENKWPRISGIASYSRRQNLIFDTFVSVFFLSLFQLINVNDEQSQWMTPKIEKIHPIARIHYFMFIHDIASVGYEQLNNPRYFVTSKGFADL